MVEGPEKGNRWIPAGFAVAFALELTAVLLMTWMRYHFQGLDPDYLALGKTANMYGLLLALPFLLLALHGLLFPRRRSLRIMWASIILPALGLILLALIITSDAANQPILGVAYLALRAVGLGLLLVIGNARRRPVWQRVLVGTGYTLLVAVGSYLIVVASIVIDPFTPPPTDTRPRASYDAGVILGAAVWSGDRPSPVFRERIQRGYELFNAGIVEFLVLTGGNAPNELTEAEVGKRELLKLGVPATSIALEEETSSTVEQILFIRDELSKQKWESFVIITDQFHLKRALEICAFNDIEAVGIPSDSPLGPYNLAIYHVRESAALILYWMFGL